MNCGSSCTSASKKLVLDTKTTMHSKAVLIMRQISLHLKVLLEHQQKVLWFLPRNGSVKKKDGWRRNEDAASIQKTRKAHHLAFANHWITFLLQAISKSYYTKSMDHDPCIMRCDHEILQKPRRREKIHKW